MQEPWISRGSALLAAFQVVHEMTLIEHFQPGDQSALRLRPWPDILARLSSAEAALLQDFTWWGPLMEKRLQQLTKIHSSIQIDQ